MDEPIKISVSLYKYKSRMTRRESLKWLGILSVSAVVPFIPGCVVSGGRNKAVAGHWPKLKLPPITALGYGKDPNLINLPTSLWPQTLSDTQLTLVAVLSDILVPRDGNVPSASEVSVPDVVNEWISAPYEKQQLDRYLIISALVWIDDEARLRFNHKFVELSSEKQIEIIDDIAYQKGDILPEFERIASAFSRFRHLVLAAFFCTPQGSKDLGYIGNIPIVGDYPGPTDAAMKHLNKKLVALGLDL